MRQRTNLTKKEKRNEALTNDHAFKHCLNRFWTTTLGRSTWNSNRQ